MLSLPCEWCRQLWFHLAVFRAIATSVRHGLWSAPGGRWGYLAEWSYEYHFWIVLSPQLGSYTFYCQRKQSIISSNRVADAYSLPQGQGLRVWSIFNCMILLYDSSVLHNLHFVTSIVPLFLYKPQRWRGRKTKWDIGVGNKSCHWFT